MNIQHVGGAAGEQSVAGRKGDGPRRVPHAGGGAERHIAKHPLVVRDGVGTAQRQHAGRIVVALRDVGADQIGGRYGEQVAGFEIGGDADRGARQRGIGVIAAGGDVAVGDGDAGARCVYRHRRTVLVGGHGAGARRQCRPVVEGEAVGGYAVQLRALAGIGGVDEQGRIAAAQGTVINCADGVVDSVDIVFVGRRIDDEVVEAPVDGRVCRVDGTDGTGRIVGQRVTVDAGLVAAAADDIRVEVKSIIRGIERKPDDLTVGDRDIVAAAASGDRQLRERNAGRSRRGAGPGRLPQRVLRNGGDLNKIFGLSCTVLGDRHRHGFGRAGEHAFRNKLYSP